MRNIRSLLVLRAVAAVCGLGMSARASTIDLLAPANSAGVPLSSLLGGNIATVGNLSFTNFGLVTQNNGAPNASQIMVQAFTAVVGEPGITFSFNWTTSGITTSPTNTMDTGIQFNVSAGGAPIITDDYLAVSGGATASSQWTVNESVTPSYGGVAGTLQNILLNSNNVLSGTQLATATFAPATSLFVNKDIQLWTINSGGVANISHVSQGFSTTVPVPAAAWTGLSTLGGLAVLGLMRKRARA